MIPPQIEAIFQDSSPCVRRTQRELSIMVANKFHIRTAMKLQTTYYNFRLFDFFF